MKKSDYVLHTKRLTLSLLQKKDAASVFAIAKNKKISRFMSWKTHKTIRESELYIQNCLDTFPIPTISWGIFLHNELIGVVSLHNITHTINSWKTDTATLGYWLSEGEWGKGYMTEAVNAVVTFAFMKLKLHKLFASHNVANTASESVIIKCGFRLIGTEKDHCFFGGRWHDGKIYEKVKKG